MSNQAPGVIVEEGSSTTLFVQQSSTATPVFIGRFSSIDENAQLGGQCIRLENWLEFSKLFTESVSYSVSVADQGLSREIANADCAHIRNTETTISIKSPYSYVFEASAKPCEPGQTLVYEIVLSTILTSSDTLAYSTSVSFPEKSTAIVDEDFTDEWFFYTDVNSTRIPAPRLNQNWNKVTLGTATVRVYLEVPTLKSNDHSGANPFLNIMFALDGDAGDEKKRKVARGDIIYSEHYVNAASATPCKPGGNLVFEVKLSKPSPEAQRLLYSTVPDEAGDSSALVDVDFTDDWSYYTDESSDRQMAPRTSDAWNEISIPSNTSIVFFEIPTRLNDSHSGVDPYLNIKFAAFGDIDNDERSAIARGDIVYPSTHFVYAASVKPCEPGEILVFRVTFTNPAPKEHLLNYSTAYDEAGESSAVEGEDYTNEWFYFTDLSQTRIKAPRTSELWNSVSVASGTSVVYFEVQTLINIAHADISRHLNIKFALPEDREEQDRTKIARGEIINTRVTISPTLYGYYALYNYFLNGGGPCYILPLSTGDENELSDLSSVIEECSDINIVVCSETNAGLIDLNPGCNKNAVYSALSPLLTSSGSYFLIADAEEYGSAPVALLKSDRCAVYYPNIISPITRKQPLDDNVKVSGYEGVDNLSDLKTSHPDIYSLARRSLDKAVSKPLVFPPSSLMAGVYATTDRERGVWKAPANVQLKGVKALEVTLSDLELGALNKNGVNSIQWFPYRGPVIYGARTQAVDSDRWCYVSVRRLFNMVERDFQTVLQTLTFEVNNSVTWERARSLIYNYLLQLWRVGGLVGSKASDAFFVRVGLGVTMNQTQVDEGLIVVEIGMAAVRPLEFILLKFSHQLQ